ncbi:hypothetical protein [Kribbella caucasensis]|nr:hypothetical protein [Kribbella sp. VKM Ac-2527]
MSGSGEEGTDRRSRRQRKRDDAARQRAMLREQRRSEPASPLGVIAVIILLAVVVLGIGGGLPRLLGGDENGQEPVGLLTPGAVEGTNPPAPTQTGTSTDSPRATSSLSTPPIQTQRPGASETASANETATNWAKLFYARTPTNETYEQLVDRAEQFTTSELASSFSSAGDATYEALAADGGTSKVVSVTVVAPRPDVAPVDTPTRITRLVTVKVATTGKRASKFDLPLLVTVIPDGDRWLVSAVNGGTGP